jgi:hypothetical protein
MHLGAEHVSFECSVDERLGRHLGAGLRRGGRFDERLGDEFVWLGESYGELHRHSRRIYKIGFRKGLADSSDRQYHASGSPILPCASHEQFMHLYEFELEHGI